MLEQYRTRVYQSRVRLIQQPPFELGRPQTKRQRLGLKYERKVLEKLGEEFGLAFIPSPWWEYQEGTRTAYCQMDGVLVLEESSTLLIVECKYSHTVEAFWQLENVYVPVLKAFLAGSRMQIATVEVVKWFDPAVRYPRRPVLRSRLEDVKVNEFAVHIMS